MDDAQPVHVIVGGGQVGQTLAARLRASGRRVRLVHRSAASARALSGLERRSADVGDLASLRAATTGASVIYHCANPPYSAADWAAHLPRWTEHLVNVASETGARLVVLDNVYAFGDRHGAPLDERADYAPCSRKGEVRAHVARQLDEAQARGDARIVVGRASDFWGPEGVATYFGDHFWPAVLRGKAAVLPVNPRTPHTYHYIPDVAAGLAALGTGPEAVTGQWWILPCQPAESTLEMVDRLARAAGAPMRARALPGWLLHVIGRFNPLMAELAEMAYQWDRPFVLQDAKFRRAFPDLRLTDCDDAARATVAWARRQYAPIASFATEPAEHIRP
jgi:nucleoside-diphosphate-sugar epimerase